MKKIFYLANVRFPSERAHATQIAHMCQAFAVAELDVFLYTNSCSTKKSNSNIESFFGFKPEFKLIMLSPHRFYGKSKFSYVFFELSFIFAFLRRYIKSQNNIIYSRDEWIILILRIFLSNQEFVYESHEAKNNFAVRKLIASKVPIIVISKGIKNFYTSIGVPQHQIFIASDAVDNSFLDTRMSQVEARRRLDLPEKKFIAMYIGGFESWKGVQTFFKASELAHSVMFVAIGGETKNLEMLKKLYPNVLFLGSRPYRDLRYNQRAADVLVVPNSAESKLGAEYTSPLKLYAHMASGVPMVVSNVPSITDVVEENGLTFFESDNPAMLADILTKASLLKIVLPVYEGKVYTWEVRAKEILNFLENYRKNNEN